jgi:hypothetical protein
VIRNFICLKPPSISAGFEPNKFGSQEHVTPNPPKYYTGIGRV